MTEPRERPSWSEYFKEIAHLAARRSTCMRRQVGAVVVKDKRILATGYNGSPSGVAHCTEAGCIREELGVPSGERHELCRGLHAEQNAVVQAAIYGVSILGADIYCTNFPCVICAKMLINARIRKIWYVEGYSDMLSSELLGEAGIEVVQIQS